MGAVKGTQSMQYLLIGVLVLAGLGLPAQDALNAQLRSAVKSPMLGAAIQFAVGAGALGALALLGVLGRGRVSGLAETPWWVWAGGGLLGAFAVTAALIGIPKVSAGITIGAQVFGQLLAAVVIDHFGWLGVPQVPLNPWRVVGAVGLFISAVLLQHK